MRLQKESRLPTTRKLPNNQRRVTSFLAEVSTNDNNDKKIYISMTANGFKQRYRNHQKSFRNEIYEKETELIKTYMETQAKQPHIFFEMVNFEVALQRIKAGQEDMQSLPGRETAAG